MSQFLGNHQNRLDAKGRVSVPASFRATLRSLGETAPLVLRASHKFACVEAWPVPLFESLAQPLEKIDLFSEAHDDLAVALYAGAFPVEADREGRIVLPEPLVAHAELQGTVMFMGLGRIFQIWEPAAGKARHEEANERAKTRGLTLPGIAA